MHRIAKLIVALSVLGGSAALSAPAENLGVLSGLRSGKWIVTPRDGGPPRALCLGDPAQLAQLRHGGRICNRYVVESGADRTTIQYTCRGAGFGRTSIRRETRELVQIDSQGALAGRPFQFTAEARRVGPCR